MKYPRRAPREVYRVYTEQEFLADSGRELPTATPARGRALAVTGGVLLALGALSVLGGLLGAHRRSARVSAPRRAGGLANAVAYTRREPARSRALMRTRRSAHALRRPMQRRRAAHGGAPAASKRTPRAAPSARLLARSVRPTPAFLPAPASPAPLDATRGSEHLAALAGAREAQEPRGEFGFER